MVVTKKNKHPNYNVYRPKYHCKHWSLYYAKCKPCFNSILLYATAVFNNVQGGSNMTGADLCVNKPHCAAAVRP